MLPDPLTVIYLLLFALAIWGALALMAVGRRYPAFFLGVATFLAVAYAALGSGFSIRIPYFHQKMEVVVYTTYKNRVHALAHPEGRPGEPLHIVFSINPASRKGGRMRKSFFDAVRAREGKRHKGKIIVDMRGYMTEQGEKKFKIPRVFPLKQE